TRNLVKVTDRGVTNDVTATLDGGRIAGEISFRDGTAAQAKTDLDNLAFDLSTKINAASRNGLALDGTNNHNLFVEPTTATGAAAAFAVDPTVAANNRLLATGGAGQGTNGNGGILGVLALKDQPLAGGGQRTFADEAIRTLGSVGSAASDAVAS